jgi:hypothetical protein
MGLDMYLTAKRFISNYNPSDQDLRSGIMDLDFGLNGMEPSAVSFEAMYWRKANAIHHWFVQNVQSGEDDCKEYYVTNEELSTLRELCNKVLVDPDKAEDLLPTQSGFFFGGTEIDEWYLDGLKYTVERLDFLLELPEVKENNVNFYYQSSW